MSRTCDDWTNVPDRRIRVTHVVLAVIGTVALAVWDASPTPAAQLTAQAQVTLVPASGPAGASIVVRGSGFSALMSGQVFWDGSSRGMPSVSVDSNGSFSAVITVLAQTAGTHVVSVVVGRVLASAPFIITTVPTPMPTSTPPPRDTVTPVPTATRTPVPTATPGPTPTPAPAPGMIPVPNAPLKDTNYPISNHALFVSVSGNDMNPGTQAMPLRTIQRAVSAAPAGGTIVIRQGEYREFVRITNKALTLQPFPHEQVWLKGSVLVTGWVPDGSAWRKDGWTFRFTPAGSIVMDPAYPMSIYPDMVFIDGRALRQVGSRGAVTAGTFFVDSVSNRLYIGDNPSGRQVEGSAVSNVLQVHNGSGTIIRGLGFAHAASTATASSGAVQLLGGSSNVVVENNVFAWNAAAGLEVGPSSNVSVRGNAMLFNGLVGLSGWGGLRGTVVEGNRFAHNNQERFSMYWAAGGMKINGGIDITVRDNVAEDNIGAGLWCDISSYNVTIARNLVRNNQLYGIMYEISAKAIIASNVVVNHPNASGIYVSESSQVQVYNNSVANGLRDISVYDSNRLNTNASQIAQGITWEVRDVVIKNNILSNTNTSNQHMLGVYDEQSRKAAEAMVSALDSNAYYRRSSSSPIATHRWGRQGQGSTYYLTVDQLRTATGKELRGLAIDNVPIHPFFINEAGGDYRLVSGSQALGTGEPLPADIAAAIGVMAGVAVNRGALRWVGGP
jgi:hypothetical protein